MRYSNQARGGQAPQPWNTQEGDLLMIRALRSGGVEFWYRLRRRYFPASELQPQPIPVRVDLDANRRRR